jgi:hypothetical protein
MIAAFKYPVGQIIFDINGEYAIANLQDEGTAIFELYKEDTIRYSVFGKEGFAIMRVNFYRETHWFNLITSHFKQIKESSDYVNSFLAISLEKPEDYDSVCQLGQDSMKVAFSMLLYRAGFLMPKGFKVKFEGKKGN